MFCSIGPGAHQASLLCWHSPGKGLLNMSGWVLLFQLLFIFVFNNIQGDCGNFYILIRLPVNVAVIDILNRKNFNYPLISTGWLINVFTRITKVQHTLKSCYLFVFSLSNDQQILNYTPEGRSPKIQQLSKKSTYNKRTAKRLAAQVDFYQNYY